MIRFLSKASARTLSGVALLRLDFNTEDEWRMEATLPTVKFLARRARAVLAVSHRGRPKGVQKNLSLQKDARALARLLKKEVRFIPHFRFAEIRKMLHGAPRGSIFLLENIRFLKGEATPGPELAKKLAALADYYVNDAFAVSHHLGDSVNGIVRFLPSYAGLELEKEVTFLGRAVRRPRRPLVVVIGGAKAGEKLGVIRNFHRKADAILLGGRPANAVLKVRGLYKGDALPGLGPNGRAALRAAARAKNVVVPVDWKTERGIILDIGPRTARLFGKHLARARTIIWNGPVGQIERKKFAGGTLSVVRAIARNRRAFSITGGGETVMFLKKHRLDKGFSFISTGGGALLTFLAGEKLPGVEALKR